MVSLNKTVKYPIIIELPYNYCTVSYKGKKNVKSK